MSGNRAISSRYPEKGSVSLLSPMNKYVLAVGTVRDFVSDNTKVPFKYIEIVVPFFVTITLYLVLFETE